MIKESKIKDLIYGKVANLLIPELERYDFKYLKSKRYFLRQEKNFHQVITLYNPYSPIYFDEDTERVYLQFNISYQIEIPDYEKWYLEKLESKPGSLVRSPVLTSQVELFQEDFKDDNFYTPSASQKFKKYVTNSLASARNNKVYIIPLDELLRNQLPVLISKISDDSDILKIFEKREHPLQHTYLLIYGGYTDLSNEQLDKIYRNNLDTIEDKLKLSDINVGGAIQNLETFIKIAQNVSQRSYINPYKRGIHKLTSQKENFVFSEILNFLEILRFDISQYEINNCEINAMGDIFLLVNKQRIIKINGNGDIVFEKEIETKKGFEKIYWDVPSGVITETLDFYVNNYIVTNDNRFIELPLPIEKLKNKKLQKSVITELAYWQKEEKYILLYRHSFLTFDRMGIWEKTFDTGKSICRQIIIEKEWIITQIGDTEIQVLDFNGNEVGLYDFGLGNTSFEFSHNYKYLICFGYSTKSQFYNLTNGEKNTLWAHPTFIRGYIEKLYNDIHHNFGMTKAGFSPDDTYIVGGADHGKYVAWTLPGLERIELIPKLEVIEKLEPVVIHSNGTQGSTDKIIKPELITLDKHTFLKNRNNKILNIIFPAEGDVFLTVIGNKLILSWDGAFHNLTCTEIIGKIEYHSQKYLTQRSKSELIIYKQK
ncbi:MAG: WD40 repeat domain-containing protein [Saprospiraceae bacterium]|uniref:WD40 repeat domain-containing protein n=1 Tax=Candidatus Opimibacter skivensis TaxID=2982028 RepID=A0A9D7XR07_9BACT|nr:WD40 repeat domain-containing protein [Candidatus Opimibacter skivensis]